MICPKCGGPGKLPFVNSNGEVVSNVWLYCECKVEADRIANDTYQSFNPDDIDFPVSYAWRRFYETQGGHSDPGAIETSQPEVTERVIRQPADLRPIKAELNHIKNTINEHIDASIRASKRRSKGQY